MCILVVCLLTAMLYLLSNLGMGNMKRGDGYMDAFEPILSKVPWLPVIGNHEYYDGTSLYRYVNQTDYEAVLPAFPSPATASLVRKAQPSCMRWPIA